MPKYPGVYFKKIKSGNKYFGSKWYRGRTYNTHLYPTAREAYEALQQLIRELESGIRKDKRNLTVEQFIKIYVEDYINPKQIQPISKRIIAGRLKSSIIPLLGSCRLQSLTPKDMQHLRNELLKMYSTNTAKYHIETFHQVIKRAVIWDYLPKDIMLGLDSIRAEKIKPELLEPDQVIGLVYNDLFPLWERCLVALGGIAGLRISEAVAIQKGKIDFNTSSIHINLQFCQGHFRAPKMGKSRYVPILPDLEYILKEIYLKSIGPWLFPGGKTGQPIYPSTFNKHHFRPMLRELGLPAVKYHSLRHTFNKMLLDQGIPRREVMQIMGHASEEMSVHYDQESVKRLVQVTRDIKIRRA